MLDQRLSLIARLVPPCRGVADVGADHGLLICQLIQEGRAQWGIATDIHEKPLEKARREADSRGLGGKVLCLLADGLGELPPDGLDAVVVAGMGGDTIAHILESWPHAKTSGITWLLQPMTKAERLREWLWKNGFDIRREPCCRANGRVYSVLEAAWTGADHAPGPAELHLGRVDPAESPESREYCRMILERAEKRARGTAGSPGQEREAAEAAETWKAVQAALEEKGAMG